MTFADIIGAAAFILCILMLAALFDMFRTERAPLTESNAEAVGDGAWFDPPKPQSARIADIPEQTGF